MEVNEAINLIKQHILNKITKKDKNVIEYNFSNLSNKRYNFNGIDIYIDIKIFDDRIYLIVRSQLYSVNKILLELKYLYKDDDLNDLEELLEKIITDVYNLKNDYVYSKNLDRLFLKDDVEKFEKLYKAELLISHRTEEITECCVCYEENSVFTNCKHNLCRKCHSDLPTKICPICRQFITCYIDYDSDF